MAKKLNFNPDMDKIISKGVEQPLSFFLIESYRQLVSHGKIHSSEALELRQKLLDVGVNHQKNIPFDVAIIDFETCFSQLDEDGCSVEQSIAPLTAYIEKYGNSDKENIWRLHLIISQVYLDKNQLAYALRHAQECYEAAPTAARPKIARAIENIGAKIHA